MSKKGTPLWHKARLQVKKLKAPYVRSIFGSWKVEKVHAVVARSTFRSQKRKKLTGSEHFWTFRYYQKRWQAWDIWRGSAKMHGAVQETCSSELFGGQGADFLREVAFWSIRFQVCWDFAWQMQHFVWPGLTFSWQAHYFRQAAWKHRKNALVRGRHLCTQLSIFEGRLTELLRFWCCQLLKMRKSRRIVSFLTLSSSKIMKVSQNCCVFDVVKFKTWGSLAE